MMRKMNKSPALMRSALASLRALAAAAWGLGVLATAAPALAQVVQVPFEREGALAQPTSTFFWKSATAKAILVFIPGGEGRLALAPERKGLGGFYGEVLKPLADNKLTRGEMHVVVFDSPVDLPVGTTYPDSRRDPEHLQRIDSVVRHYVREFGLPVWLMGHSNGAASVTEFYKMLQEARRDKEIAGMVYSAARNGADFAANTQLPVLFLAHERDGCARSLPANSLAVHDRLRNSNAKPMRYIVLKGGEAQPQNPCNSGFHMFFGASAEAYQAIDEFVGTVLR
jgi:hypothetical protein